MKKLYFLFCLLALCSISQAQVFDVDTLQWMGDINNRVNLVILGDGYTSSEQNKMITDAQSVSSKFFQATPYKEYKNYFNVFLIKVISNQSGATHAHNSSDNACGSEPTATVDNYFGSAFDGGISGGSYHRLLVVTKGSKVTNVLAANFPNYDQALVIVNTSYYGGSGGSIAVSSLNSSASEIAIHEVGHSFAKLNDEYEINEGEGINTTTNNNLSTIKWKNWVGISGVGAYKMGALNMYKPVNGTCKMEYLGSPFCPVCRETHVKKVQSLTQNYDSFTPSNSSTLTVTGNQVFNIKTILPIPNTLKITWTLNGTPISAAKNLNNITLPYASLNGGGVNNTLVATISDTTSYIKIASTTSYQISWTIKASTANQLPAVSITAPTSGATFTVPASVTISANATDADGTISKVEFYNGTTLLNSDATSPYSYIWTGVTAGTYPLTAKAYDNTGATKTSTAVSITVNAANQLPTVSITAPTNGAAFASPASVTISANATDTDGTISKVEFYNGTTLLNSDNASPYSYAWTGVAVGTYSLTAKAYDNTGATKTSTAVSITINPANQLPTVSITAPTNGATFASPASVTISANAADADGTISKVEFYNGTTLLNSDNASPYSYAWTGVAAGTYSLTAKAYDNTGATKTSTVVSITVNPPANQLPTVSITAPTNGATFTAPASVAISANATDADGTISKVEFYNGTTLLNSDNASPYTYSWTGVAAGTYSLTAKAYDNTGATKTSSVVAITVNPAQTGTEDCSNIATWNSASIYVKDDLVTFSGSKYKAKWWTQNNSPATNSGTWDVWLKLGECIPGTLASAVPVMSLEPSDNTTIVIPEVLNMNVTGLSSGTATQVTYIFYKDELAKNTFVKNGPNYSASWSALEIGDYLLQVIVKDQKGMLIYSDAKSVKVSQVTDMTSELSSDVIKVIPNPNNAKFHLSVPSNFSLVGSTIELMDMMGHKVYESAIQSEGEEIAPYQLRAGVYLLKVTSGDKIYNTKIQIY